MSYIQLKSATQLINTYILTIYIYKFFFQDRGLDFGLTVLPCSTPPGVKIFGSAPQFNAKNFSHVFVHGSDYEIPGKTDFCYILRKEKKMYVTDQGFWRSGLHRKLD